MAVGIRRKTGRRSTIALAKIGRHAAAVGVLVTGIGLTAAGPAQAAPRNAASAGDAAVSININGSSSPQSHRECIALLNKAIDQQYRTYRQDNGGALPDGETLAGEEQHLDATAPCGTTASTPTITTQPAPAGTVLASPTGTSSATASAVASYPTEQGSFSECVSSGPGCFVPPDAFTQEFLIGYRYDQVWADVESVSCTTTGTLPLVSNTLTFCGAVAGTNPAGYLLSSPYVLVRDQFDSTDGYGPVSVTFHFWYWANIYPNGSVSYGCREC